MFNLIFYSMLQCTIIGNIGADATVKEAEGREFVAFRVAHNESFTGADGTKKETSMWVDCTMSCSNGRPAVLPYLKKGTTVCVTGNVSLRVYSSEKDRCMKAGMKIQVQKLELIGGQVDSVPRRLYTKDGEMVQVNKYYHGDTKEAILMDERGNQYQVAEGGWIAPMQTNSDQNGNG